MTTDSFRSQSGSHIGGNLPNDEAYGKFYRIRRRTVTLLLGGVIPAGVGCYQLIHGHLEAESKKIEERCKQHYTGVLLEKDAHIQNIEGRLAGLQSDMGKQQSQLSQEKNDLEKTLQQKEVDLQVAMSQVASLQQQVQSLKQQLDNTASGQPATDDSVRTQLAKLHQTIDSQQTEIQFLREQKIRLEGALKQRVPVSNEFELKVGQSKDAIKQTVWVGLHRLAPAMAEISVHNKPYQLGPGQSINFEYGSFVCHLVLRSIEGGNQPQEAKFLFGCKLPN
jgi:uncharacterized protein YoxC